MGAQRQSSDKFSALDKWAQNRINNMDNIFAARVIIYFGWVDSYFYYESFGFNRRQCALLYNGAFCLAEYACGKSGREAVVSFVLLRSNLLASRPKAQKIKKVKKHFA